MYSYKYLLYMRTVSTAQSHNILHALAGHDVVFLYFPVTFVRFSSALYANNEDIQVIRYDTY